VLTNGRGVRQQLNDAVSAGTIAGDTVVTTHTYGRGRAATITFDPEANPSTAMANLLVGAVRYAATADRPNDAPRYVRFDMASASQASVDVKLVASLGGLVLVSAPGAVIQSPPTWTLTLSPGQTANRTLIVNGVSPGTYHVDGTLSYLYGGAYYPAANATVTLTLQ
jgi:hypothetical protein